jgi:hypothetical protein
MVRSSSASRALLFSLAFATVLTGFVSLSPPALGDHDTLAWRYFGPASLSPGYDLGQATVFADRAGHFYIFYTNLSTTTGLSNLSVMKFATRGDSNVPVKIFDRRVNTLAGSVFYAIEPAAAMGQAGALYVAYSEIRSGSSPQVYVSKSTDGGATWSPEVPANGTGGTAVETSPSLAVAPNGNVFVVWVQSWGAEQNVSASVSTNGGATFGRVQNITGVPRNQVQTASVTTDSRSRAYVVYDDHDFATDQFNVNLTWSDDGVSWSPPRTLSGPKANVFLPVIQADPADRLHLAWIDTLGLTSQVWYSRSDDRGATWTPPVTVSQNTADAMVDARTSIGISGGTLMVAWTADQGNRSGLAFATSADGGDRWSSERFVAVPNISTKNAVVTADENGTFYAAPTQETGSPAAVFLEYWYGPPTAPTITTIGRGTGQLDVRWTGSPERNVAGYRVWRSSDGVSYTIVASVAATSTNHTDRGLANGTYWYSIEAVNDQGIPSHRSAAVHATVGPSMDDEIADLLAQIAALKAQLANLNNSSGQDAAALRARIDELQSRLNALRPEPADQTMGFVNAGLLVIAITLLALVVLLQSKKPKPQPPIVLPQHRYSDSDVLRSEELASDESANLPLPGFEDDL